MICRLFFYFCRRHLGIVRGITVRTCGIGGKLWIQFRGIVGGQVETYIPMCEVARAGALDEMVKHVMQLGTNAVVGVRYDSNELEPGMTEVLVYGIAVVVQPKLKVGVEVRSMKLLLACISDNSNYNLIRKTSVTK